MVPLRKLQSFSASSCRVWCVAWSHKGDILASCGEDRSINFWSCAADGSWNTLCTLPGCSQRSVRCIAWSPCDNYLASASFDATITVWKLTKSDSSLEAEALATLEGHTSEVKCVAWSPSGRLIASCGRDKSVWFWEFDEEEDVQCVSVLQPHSQDVKSVSWHPFEEILVSCSYDNTLNLYIEELDDWVVAVQLNGHTSTVWKAEFSSTGDILASCSDDRSIKLWTAAGECTRIVLFPHTENNKKRMSPDGQMLATCGADNRLCVFRLAEGNLVSIAGRTQLADSPMLWGHAPCAHPQDINCVRWHPVSCLARSTTTTAAVDRDLNVDAKLCTAGDDGVISFWTISTLSLNLLSASEKAID
ncbi:putative cytosolic iron-sulfur protein assembly protein 1 [Paragonimus heterotremus]|uniref:Probable cytosolic iron-sulfur protein assembly protein CIAO1 homolog n=1 Tax=Paragonimus heterotremus TaxID=100268 RepID=A0A8J4TJW3_9TREM|nr:putative cytosolic iron-sulfur protein assembly protein 1 [Paragonimus heterotremus]